MGVICNTWGKSQPFTVSVVLWQRYLETWSREEVCSVIWFLWGENISPLEIQSQVIQLHCDGVMRVWNPAIMVERLRKLLNGHMSYDVRILIMYAIELGFYGQTLPEHILTLRTTYWLQKSAIDCGVRGKNTSCLRCVKEWTWYNILFENISWYPRPVCVRYVADRVALGQVFLPAVQFYPVSIVTLLFHAHSFTTDSV